MNKEEWSKTYRYQEHELPYFDADFKFLWPRQDESLHGDCHTLAQLDKDVFPLVKNKFVAIQAGGAMGMWAKRMAQLFDIVYTFEPTPQSFYCLNFNCPEENIIAFNAAIGEKAGMINMAFPEHLKRSKAKKDNYGGFRCFPGGIVPTMRIDCLDLPGCDLLFLDLEGFELFALKGAIRTIKKYKPVIVLEDKGCSNAFGYNKGDVERYLHHEAGYITHGRFHGGRDVICIHRGTE